MELKFPKPGTLVEYVHRNVPNATSAKCSTFFKPRAAIFSLKSIEEYGRDIVTIHENPLLFVFLDFKLVSNGYYKCSFLHPVHGFLYNGYASTPPSYYFKPFTAGDHIPPPT